jgi:hypothetical protein
VKTGRNHTKHAHVDSRRKFYDWLAKTIRIDGIEKVARDTAFDTTHLFSGGIRLSYESITQAVEDLREGVLLEANNATSALYYADKPRLDEILAEIGKWADRL